MLLLSAVPTHAEEAPTPPPPPPEHTSLPREFLEQFLSFDPTSNQVLMGRQRRPLSRTEFFNLLGRPELVAQSESLSQQRVILGVTAGAVAAAGIITAAVAWGGLPDLNSSFCIASTENYNNVCTSQYMQRQSLGAAGLVGGLTLGALFATFAYWADPNVLSADQTVALASQHNAALMQRARAAHQGTTPQLHLLPYATLQGGGLLTSFVF